MVCSLSRGELPINQIKDQTSSFKCANRGHRQNPWSHQERLTGANQSTNPKTCSGYPEALFVAFCTMIWKCNECCYVCAQASHRRAKESSMEACHLMKDGVTDDPEFNKIISGDELWCYGYNPESKQQWNQWKSSDCPRPKKSHQVELNLKTILICIFFFFTSKGLYT